MANSLWNFVTKLVPGTLAKAEDVNVNFEGIQAGFDAVEAGVGNTMRVVNEAGVTTISLGAVARALRVVAFDASGDLIADVFLGENKGNHVEAAGTDYKKRDIIKDAAGSEGLNNIYMCNTDHTSGADFSTDFALGYWDLLINVVDVEIAKTAAEAAETLAAMWASQTSGIVDATDFAAKAWAIGGTGVTDTASGGAAKEWATAAEDDLVDTAEYSAKHYSIKATAQAVAAAASAVAAASSAAELQGYATLTSGASTVIPMDSQQTLFCSLSTNWTTMTTSGRSSGASVTLIIAANGADRTITYNASWIQIGVLPTTIPAGKALMLSFVARADLESVVYVTGGLQL